MIRTTVCLTQTHGGTLERFRDDVASAKGIDQSPRPVIGFRLRSDPEQMLEVIDTLQDFIGSVNGRLAADATCGQFEEDVVEEDPRRNLRGQHQQALGSTRQSGKENPGKLGHSRSMRVARAPQHRGPDVHASEGEFERLANAIDHKDSSLETACRLLLELEKRDRPGSDACRDVTKWNRQ